MPDLWFQDRAIRSESTALDLLGTPWSDRIAAQ